MATLSHNLLVAAILSYLFAMMCYAAEYAFGAEGAVARVAEARSSKVLVGAGAPISDDVDFPGLPPVSVEPMAPDRLGRYAPIAGRAAVILTAVGLVAHIACLVTRGFAAHRVPWGNMYEFIIAVTLVASIGWLGLVTRRPSVRPLGLFVTFVLVALLGLDDTVLYTKVSPLSPALNSYWLKIHVTLAITASGILMIGFCAAATAPGAGRLREAGRRGAAGRLPVHARAASARCRQSGAADLPDPRVRVSHLDARDHLRRDLGRVGVGPLLGLGPEGDVGVHRLGRVRLLPARPCHARA